MKPSMSSDALPLEGIKVVDFGTAIVGPLTSRVLSDCGATVIKIETALRPDVLRLGGPYKDGKAGIDRSGYFVPFNLGKMSIALNLTLPKAREIARKLAAWADLVIETYTPRVMKGWELDYPALSRINPQLIMISHCLQGQSGPRANMRGFGTQSAALAGLFELTGWAGEEPVGPFAAYPDWIAYHFTLCSLLAALDYRHRTGKGQYIDQAQLESTMQFMAHSILDYTANGRIATRMGNRDLQMAPHGAFRCRGQDTWCVIAVENDEQWQSLCRVMERPDLDADPRYKGAQARKAHEDEIEPIIEAWTVEREPQEVMRLLQQNGVAAGYIAKPGDLFEDSQLSHRKGFVELEHPEIGRHRAHTLGFKLSETPLLPKRSSPLLGEHTDYILKEILQLPEAEIAECREEGIFQ